MKTNVAVLPIREGVRVARAHVLTLAVRYECLLNGTSWIGNGSLNRIWVCYLSPSMKTVVASLPIREEVRLVRTYDLILAVKLERL